MPQYIKGVRTTNTAKTPRLTIDVRQLEKYMRDAGIKDRAALSRRMGVNKSTVTRLMNGETGIGPAVYPGLRRAFPDLDFDLIFPR